MRKTSLMLLTNFFKSFLGSIFFFACILQLGDLYVNLLKYAENGVTLDKIAFVQFLFLPYCISKGLPIAILFATCFTIGNFYVHNELIVVLTLGISLKRFVAPLLVVGLMFSLFLYFFQEYVVIDTLNNHDKLQKIYLGEDNEDENVNDNFFLSDKDFTIVYDVGYYEENENGKVLRNTFVTIRDENKIIIRALNFEKAKWLDDKSVWELGNVSIYRYDLATKLVSEEYKDTYIENYMTTPPKNFRQLNKNLEKERKKEAKATIDTLRSSGLPYKLELAQYYQRYTFAITPLIVTIMAVSMGSRLKKNILLLSLFLSVLLAVIYYVVNMVFVLSTSFLPPFIAASGSIFMFLILGIVLLLRSRT